MFKQWLSMSVGLVLREGLWGGFGGRIEKGMGYLYILFYLFLLKVFMTIRYHFCNEKYFLCSKIPLPCSEGKSIST